MPVYPVSGRPMPPLIPVFGDWGRGVEVAALATTAPTSVAWPSANLAIYIPFEVCEPITIVKLWCYNGATASNNIDMGIYDAVGTRLVSIGSTAQAGTSAIQEFDITDTRIYPGRFYLAIAMNGTTGTMFRVGPTIHILKALGIYQQASAFALPASATFAVASSGYIPFVGLSQRTLVA